MITVFWLKAKSKYYIANSLFSRDQKTYRKSLHLDKRKLPTSYYDLKSRGDIWGKVDFLYHSNPNMLINSI